MQGKHPPSVCTNGLKSLLDASEQAIKGLRNLKCSIDNFDICFVYLIVEKLDPGTRESWEIYQESIQGFSTYKVLTIFIENRIRLLEQSNTRVFIYELDKNLKSHKNDKKLFTNAHSSNVENYNPGERQNKKTACPVCKGNHWLSRCQQFQSAIAEKRREAVKRENLYNNCLKAGHNVNSCSSKSICYVCNGKHFTALHTDKLSSSSKNSESNVCFSEEDTINSNSGEIVGAHYVSNNLNKHINIFVDNGQVLTGTAKVTLQSHNGLKIYLFNSELQKFQWSWGMCFSYFL